MQVLLMSTCIDCRTSSPSGHTGFGRSSRAHRTAPVGCRTGYSQYQSGGVILGPTHLRHTPSIQHQNPVIVRNLPVSAPSA